MPSSSLAEVLPAASPVPALRSIKRPIVGRSSVRRTIQAEPAKPTRDQFVAYQGMFSFFNRRLFGGALPNVVLNFSRHANSYGFFAPVRWSEAKGQGSTHEISLNPDTIGTRSARDVASTLVHEMVHLWQQEHGTMPRRGYHDKQWAAKMVEIGLMPSSTGLPGGKQVGQRMTHYIVDGGGFDLAFAAMPPAYLLPWASAAASGGATKTPKKKDASKVKYSCEGCGSNVWGKQGLNIECADCDCSFTEAQS